MKTFRIVMAAVALALLPVLAARPAQAQSAPAYLYVCAYNSQSEVWGYTDTASGGNVSVYRFNADGSQDYIVARPSALAISAPDASGNVMVSFTESGTEYHYAAGQWSSKSGSATVLMRIHADRSVEQAVAFDANPLPALASSAAGSVGIASGVVSPAPPAPTPPSGP